MGMSQAEEFERFKEKQLELAGMLKDASGVVKGLDMKNATEVLDALGDKVENDTFRIQVVGTFKNGKSTFINSILGEEVLPAYAIPTTAVINEVKFGNEKEAVLYFRNPLPRALPEEIPQEALKHMEQYKGQEIPPMKLPYDSLEDYVVIPMGKDQKDAILESPYEKVELFWPLELLKNHVEIIDSPGLNEHKTRTTVTLEYLAKADAILFVLNATAQCSQDEMDFIQKQLKEKGFEEPFFIVNRFDLLRKKDQETVKQFFETKLRGYSDNPIFYVSALNALDGKLDGDAEKYRSSGMEEFEKQLSEYLIRNKGKAKLAQPARELKRVLNEEALFKVIPDRRKMLGSSLDDVKKRYQDAQPRLADLNMKKQQLQHKLDLRIGSLRNELYRVVTRHFTDLSAKVQTWIDEYEPENSISLIHIKSSTQNVIGELAEYVTDMMEKEQDEWSEGVLSPLIKEKMDYVFGDTEKDLDTLFTEIDKFNVELVGKEYKTNDVPVWQRVVGAIGGLAVGDVGLAMSGGLNGISPELAKTAALEVGAGFLLGFLGIFNPVTLGAIIIAVFFMNAKKYGSNATRKLKEAVRDEAIKQIAETSDNTVEKLIDDIAGKFTALEADIIHAVDVEINETNAQVQAVIAEMEKGEENVRLKQEEMNRDEEKLKDISKKLDEFIFDLVGA